MVSHFSCMYKRISLHIQSVCGEDESTLVTTYLPGDYCPVLMRKSVEQIKPSPLLSPDGSQPGSRRICRDLKARVTLSGPWRAASSEGHFAALSSPRWRGPGGEGCCRLQPHRTRAVCCENFVPIRRTPPTS